MKINGDTRVFGIIGNPVNHSLSPAMHNAAFAELGINGVYVPFLTEDVAGAVNGVRALSIDGLSVTIPHKEAVLAHLDEVDPIARRIGAANTIVVSRRGSAVSLQGCNTDWLGANHALGRHLTLAGSTAVILGAGGAARAIGFGLKKAGADIEIWSRTQSTGTTLATELDCPWQPLTEPPEKKFDILINATAVGMHPNQQLSPLPANVLTRFSVVMDIIYAPLHTTLLREAADAGCTCIDGLEMLLYQGVVQFELWTGCTAPVDTMRAALRRAAGVV
jgi:shikimate dehydrogenase